MKNICRRLTLPLLLALATTTTAEEPRGIAEIRLTLSSAIEKAEYDKAQVRKYDLFLKKPIHAIEYTGDWPEVPRKCLYCKVIWFEKKK